MSSNAKQYRVGVVMQKDAAVKQIVAELEEVGLTVPKGTVPENVDSTAAIYTDWCDFNVGTEFAKMPAALIAWQIKYGVRCVMEYRPKP